MNKIIDEHVVNEERVMKLLNACVPLWDEGCWDQLQAFVEWLLYVRHNNWPMWVELVSRLKERTNEDALKMEFAPIYKEDGSKVVECPVCGEDMMEDPDSPYRLRDKLVPGWRHFGYICNCGWCSPVVLDKQSPQEAIEAAYKMAVYRPGLAYARKN